jgi:DNA mismatch endonuclease (patch repair protein)
MSRIRSRDTKPEKAVRSLIHGMGYRFSLCRGDLPGRPDIVMSKHGTVVFVHGCFWHRHEDCGAAAKSPKSNVEFWQRKFDRNMARDEENVRDLVGLGWKVMVVWECELKDLESLEDRIRWELEEKWRDERPGRVERRIG